MAKAGGDGNNATHDGRENEKKREGKQQIKSTRQRKAYKLGIRHTQPMTSL
jgi:hypothetical protein